MNKYKFILQTNSSDINLYQCGVEFCAPNHSQGPSARSYYLLHYIMQGTGIFEVNGKTYTLNQGQAFLICPNKVSFYKSDSENPWIYSWVAFDGIKAKEYLGNAGLSSHNPIYTALNPKAVEDALLEMVNQTKKENSCELRLMGYMYMFLSTLIANCSFKSEPIVRTKDLYLQKVIEYINVNSWRKITISELAKYLNLDRSYLYSIFKQKLKMSPQEFILKFKVENACEMLSNTDMHISKIAQSIGYEDQLSFSRIFKIKTGLSPTEWRNNIK